ncbi:MAG: hypothetical protein EOP42_17630 [Sphingobacteriaceae bacterium]|nr:MAG: hypothetical protein EOP42_17630 [Sphingobacteriaceae bacterium]
MADVRLSINQDFMDDLSSKTGINKPADLTKDALTFYSWVISEVKKGRVLVTVDENGENPRKVVTETLKRAKLIS